jgi:4-hydroxythreonine-4-phosphate dehydrogenase
VDEARPGWTWHKIDSTLRGNWAHELRARQRVSSSRVVLVPAWPAMGRTCVGGEVRVHGVAIGSVLTHLPEATLLSGLTQLEDWLGGDVGTRSTVAALDVADESALTAVAAIVAGTSERLLVAGPSGALGAVARARAHGAFTPSVARPPLAMGGPVLVVSASASSVTREQLERLRVARPRVDVVAAPDASGPLHADLARELGERVRGRLGEYGTVVVIGGDTAAALLGDGPRLVGGYAAPGMPWNRALDGIGPLVVTKAGAFGGPDALVHLLAGVSGPASGETG